MKKNTLLLVILLTPFFVMGQKQRFKAKAEVIKSETLIDSLSYNSILFVYTGNAHYVNNFKDLTKDIKRNFESSDITIEFDYKLNEKEALPSDLKNIPRSTKIKSKYNLVCYIGISNMKLVGNSGSVRRKFKYYLNLKGYKEETLVKNLQLLVQTKGMITTQNSKISKLILENL